MKILYKLNKILKNSVFLDLVVDLYNQYYKIIFCAYLLM